MIKADLKYNLQKRGDYWSAIFIHTVLGTFIGALGTALVIGVLNGFFHQDLEFMSWYLVFGAAFTTSWAAYGEGVNRGVKLASEIQEEYAEYQKSLEQQKRADGS